MRAVMNSIHRFLASEDGPTAVEYAFMLVLIIIVCIAAVRTVGTSTSTVFSTAAQFSSGS